MDYLIYVITFPNGKQYVGLTKNLQGRKKKHYATAFRDRRSYKVSNAIRKYGWHSLQWEVLESGLTHSEAKVREKHYISTLGSLHSGYNMTEGGDATTWVPSEEEREQRSLQMKSWYKIKGNLEKIRSATRQALYRLEPNLRSWNTGVVPFQVYTPTGDLVGDWVSVNQCCSDLGWNSPSYIRKILNSGGKYQTYKGFVIIPVGHDFNKEIVVQAVSEMYDRGWITSRDGNCSYRVGDSLFVTRSGVDKSAMDSGDVMEVPIVGGSLSSVEGASIELDMHWEIHQDTDQGRAVVHAHPTHCVAAMHRGFNLPEVVSQFPELYRYTRVGPNVPFFPPGSPGLARSTRRSLGTYELEFDVVGQEGHGVCAWAPTFQVALEHIERLEHICQIVLASGVPPEEVHERTDLNP